MSADSIFIDSGPLEGAGSEDLSGIVALDGLGPSEDLSLVPGPGQQSLPAQGFIFSMADFVFDETNFILDMTGFAQQRLTTPVPDSTFMSVASLATPLSHIQKQPRLSLGHFCHRLMGRWISTWASYQTPQACQSPNVPGLHLYGPTAHSASPRLLP